MDLNELVNPNPSHVLLGLGLGTVGLLLRTAVRRIRSWSRDVEVSG